MYNIICKRWFLFSSRHWFRIRTLVTDVLCWINYFIVPPSHPPYYLLNWSKQKIEQLTVVNGRFCLRSFQLCKQNWLTHSLVSYYIVDFVVVHNGIITNYKDVKSFLVSIIKFQDDFPYLVCSLFLKKKKMP